MSSEQARLPAQSVIDVLVLREQATALQSAMRVTLPANIFIGLSAVGLMWHWLPHVHLVVWAVLLVLSSLARIGYANRAERSGRIVDAPDEVLRSCWIGALVSGLLWAGFLAMVLASDSVFHPALHFIICGITAGATVQGTTHRASVWAFVIPIGIMHFTSLVAEGSLAGWVLSTNAALYAFMLCRASTLSERSFIAAIRVKYEATALAAAEVQAKETTTAALRQLEYVAAHDPLTGLANRNAFKSSFEQVLRRARDRHGEVAVMLVDLDRFKAINDTFGHAAGDAVLIEVAARLRMCLKEGDIIGRIGGDEFAVLLDRGELNGEEHRIACALLDALCRPIVFGARLLQIGASIGYSHYPRDAHDVENLQICADVALYAAKSEGRRTFHAFDEDLRAVADARRVFELDLAEALAEGAIEVHFQPQMAIGNRRVCGLEALVRWNHPNHGWVAPAEIIAAAAATRQTEALTGHVVSTACRMARALAAIGHGDITISVNVSPAEFGRFSLTQLVAAKLGEFDVPAACLGIEITEEAMFSDERGAADLKALAELGVKISVDDFGVGYSSFGSLRAYGFDFIKINRTFIQAIAVSAKDRALVQAILGVARALGAEAVADGVETVDQVVLLASLGCRFIQGRYVSGPLEPKALMQWLVAGSEASLPLTRIAQRRAGT
ncbi:MAG: EAL domain-containing protein [Ancalomicrobiaceae bacterium]|nr:EAL domain-containing protein [Ancalomicrobiaceae bacterium]